MSAAASYTVDIMKTISVLIVEDDARFRAAFTSAILQARDLQLLGAAQDVGDGLDMLDAYRPDVLLVDLGLPSGSGLSLIRHAHERLADCDILVVSVFGDERHVLASIQAGATGYLLKDSSPSALAEQIRLLRRGGSPISPVIACQLLKRLPAGAAALAEVGAGFDDAVNAPALLGLSDQETQVLRWSAQGFSFDEIAQRMAVEPLAVMSSIKRIYRKLQVHSRGEAIDQARRLGWLGE
jgi:DNA-binding NarL/FixJ family response regulator